MRIRLQGWHFQLIVFSVLCFLIVPPVYRAYTKRNSGDHITREEVIGCWIQSENSERASSSQRESVSTFAIFDSDGKYYVGIKCSNSTCSEAYAGDWYYSDKRNYFFKIIPWGYQAWIRLNINHGAGPQFYLRKQNGEIRLYRGDYRAAISDEPFKRAEGVEVERLKQLALSECTSASSR